MASSMSVEDRLKCAFGLCALFIIHWPAPAPPPPPVPLRVFNLFFFSISNTTRVVIFVCFDVKQTGSLSADDFIISMKASLLGLVSILYIFNHCFPLM